MARAKMQHSRGPLHGNPPQKKPSVQPHQNSVTQCNAAATKQSHLTSLILVVAETRTGTRSKRACGLDKQRAIGLNLAPAQWIVVTHVQPLIPQEPPRTPAESQGRRLARQKSLPPSVSELKSPEKTRFRQSFPCETTSRTLNRGRTSSVSGSIGPCAGLLNSQDTHHVRDTLVCHPYVQRFEI